MIKTSKFKNLTQVQYPTSTQWDMTRDNTELEAKILEQQNKHFTQANHTPIEAFFQENPEYKLPDVMFENITLAKIPDTNTKIK